VTACDRIGDMLDWLDQCTVGRGEGSVSARRGLRSSWRTTKPVRNDPLLGFSPTRATRHSRDPEVSQEEQIARLVDEATQFIR
jgi:hypothetical protein